VRRWVTDTHLGSNPGKVKSFWSIWNKQQKA
jgi:hypothetical protein